MMANPFIHKEVCGTCNGEGFIVCCSCNAEETCQEFTCPTCGGKKYFTKPNVPAIIGACVAAVAVIVILSIAL